MTLHAVCHDCDAFEIVHDAARSELVETVRLHAAANPEHDVSLAEVA
jgi:hypothetical protein